MAWEENIMINTNNRINKLEETNKIEMLEEKITEFEELLMELTEAHMNDLTFMGVQQEEILKLNKIIPILTKEKDLLKHDVETLREEITTLKIEINKYKIT